MSVLIILYSLLQCGHTLSAAEGFPLQLEDICQEELQLFQMCSPPQLEKSSLPLQFLATCPNHLNVILINGVGM